MSFILSVYLTQIHTDLKSEFAGDNLVCKLIDFEALNAEENGEGKGGDEEPERVTASRSPNDMKIFNFPEESNNFEFLISRFSTLTLMVYDERGEHGMGYLQVDAEQEGDVSEKAVVCDISNDGEVIGQALMTMSLVSITNNNDSNDNDNGINDDDQHEESAVFKELESEAAANTAAAAFNASRTGEVDDLKEDMVVLKKRDDFDGGIGRGYNNNDNDDNDPEKDAAALDASRTGEVDNFEEDMVVLKKRDDFDGGIGRGYNNNDNDDNDPEKEAQNSSLHVINTKNHDDEIIKPDISKDYMSPIRSSSEARLAAAASSYYHDKALSTYDGDLKLSLSVIRAVSLIDRGSAFDSQDPMVRLTVGNQTFTTERQKDAETHAAFPEKFVFTFPASSYRDDALELKAEALNLSMLGLETSLGKNITPIKTLLSKLNDAEQLKLNLFEGVSKIGEFGHLTMKATLSALSPLPVDPKTSYISPGKQTKTPTSSPNRGDFLSVPIANTDNSSPNGRSSNKAAVSPGSPTVPRTRVLPKQQPDSNDASRVARGISPSSPSSPSTKKASPRSTATSPRGAAASTGKSAQKIANSALTAEPPPIFPARNDWDPVNSQTNSFVSVVESDQYGFGEELEKNKRVVAASQGFKSSAASWDRISETNNTDLSKITDALNRSSFFINKVQITCGSGSKEGPPPSCVIKASLVPLPGKVVSMKSSVRGRASPGGDDSTFVYDFPENKKKLSFAVSVGEVRSKFYKALSPCLYIQVILDDGVDNNKNTVFTAAVYICSLIELESLANKLITVPMSSETSKLTVSIQIGVLRNISNKPGKLPAADSSVAPPQPEKLAYGSVCPGSYVGMASLRLNIIGLLLCDRLPFLYENLGDPNCMSSLTLTVKLLSSKSSSIITLSPSDLLHVKQSKTLFFNRKISFDCQTEFLHLDVLEFAFVLETLSGTKKHLGLSQVPVKTIATASYPAVGSTRRGLKTVSKVFSADTPLSVPFVSFDVINGNKQPVICDWKLIAAFDDVLVDSGVSSARDSHVASAKGYGDTVGADHKENEIEQTPPSTNRGDTMEDVPVLQSLPKSFVPPETIDGVVRLCVQGFVCTNPGLNELKQESFTVDFGLYPMSPGSGYSITSAIEDSVISSNKSRISTSWKSGNVVTIPIIYSCQQLKVAHLKLSLKPSVPTSTSRAFAGIAILDVASVVVGNPNCVTHLLLPVRSAQQTGQSGQTQGWLMVSFQFYSRGCPKNLVKEAEMKAASEKQWALTLSNASSIPLCSNASAGSNNNNNNNNNNNSSSSSSSSSGPAVSLHVAMAPSLGALSIDYFDIERRAGNDIYIVFQIVNRRSSSSLSGVSQKVIKLRYDSDSSSYKWEFHDAILSIENISFWDVALSVSLIKVSADTAPNFASSSESASIVTVGESIISLPSDHLKKGVPINLNVPLRSSSAARIAVISLSVQHTSLSVQSNANSQQQALGGSPLKRSHSNIAALNGNKRSVSISFVDGARMDMQSSEMQPFFECVLIPPTADGSSAPSSGQAIAFSGSFKTFSDLSINPVTASMQILLEDDAAPETTRDEVSTNKWSLLLLCRDSLLHRAPKIGWTRISLPWSMLTRGRDLEQWVTLVSNSPSVASSLMPFNTGNNAVSSAGPSSSSSLGEYAVGRVRIIVKCAAAGTDLGSQSRLRNLSQVDAINGGAMKGVGFVFISVNALYENRAGQEKDTSKISVATITSYKTSPLDGDSGKESKNLAHYDFAATLENNRFSEIALSPVVSLKQIGNTGSAALHEAYVGMVAVPGSNCELLAQIATENSIVPYSAAFSALKAVPYTTTTTTASRYNKSGVAGSVSNVHIESARLKLSLSSSQSKQASDENRALNNSNSSSSIARVQRRTPVVDVIAIYVPFVRGKLSISILSTTLTPFLESRLMIKPEASRRLYFRVMLNEYTFAYSTVFNAPLSSSPASTSISTPEMIILPIDTARIYQGTNINFKTLNVQVTLMDYNPLPSTSNAAQGSSNNSLNEHVKGMGYFDMAPLFHLACRSASSSSSNSPSFEIGVSPKTIVDIDLIDTDSKLLLGKSSCSIQLELEGVDDAGVSSMYKASSSDETTSRLELGLKQAFLLADVDKSGSVSSTELLDVIKKGSSIKPPSSSIGKEINKTLIKKKTQKVVGMEDPIALLMGLTRANQFTTQGQDFSVMTNETGLDSRVREIFSKLDVDGDGMISWWEWKTVLFLSLSAGGAVNDLAVDSLVMGSLAAKNALKASKGEMLYNMAAPNIQSEYNLDDLHAMVVRIAPLPTYDRGVIGGRHVDISGMPLEKAVDKLELAIQNLRAHNLQLSAQLNQITAKSAVIEAESDAQHMNEHQKALARVTLKLQQSEQVIKSYEKIIKNRVTSGVPGATNVSDFSYQFESNALEVKKAPNRLVQAIRNPITSTRDLDGKVAEVEEKHRRKLSGMLKDKAKKLEALNRITKAIRRYVQRFRERKARALKEEKDRQAATLKLQGGARGFVERKKLKKLEKKATVIQAHLRGLIARKVRERLLLERTMAIFSKEYRASSIISRVVKRFYLAFVEKKNKAAESIQQAFKSKKAKKEGRMMLDKMKVQRVQETESALQIQKLSKIRKSKKEKKKQLEQKKVQDGAKKVQSLYRGHKDRKRVSNIKMEQQFTEERAKLLSLHKSFLANAKEGIGRMTVKPGLNDCANYWVLVDPEKKLAGKRYEDLLYSIGTVSGVDPVYRLLTMIKVNSDATAIENITLSTKVPYDHPALVWLAPGGAGDYSSDTSDLKTSEFVTLKGVGSISNKNGDEEERRGDVRASEGADKDEEMKVDVGRFAVGDLVGCNFRDAGVWYDATIINAISISRGRGEVEVEGGTDQPTDWVYDIRFDADGSESSYVEPDLLRIRDIANDRVHVDLSNSNSKVEITITRENSARDLAQANSKDEIGLSRDSSMSMNEKVNSVVEIPLSRNSTLRDSKDSGTESVPITTAHAESKADSKDSSIDRGDLLVLNDEGELNIIKSRNHANVILNQLVHFSPDGQELNQKKGFVAFIHESGTSVDIEFILQHAGQVQRDVSLSHPYLRLVDDVYTPSDRQLATITPSTSSTLAFGTLNQTDRSHDADQVLYGTKTPNPNGYSSSGPWGLTNNTAAPSSNGANMSLNSTLVSSSGSNRPPIGESVGYRIILKDDEDLEEAFEGIVVGFNEANDTINVRFENAEDSSEEIFHTIPYASSAVIWVRLEEAQSKPSSPSKMKKSSSGAFSRIPLISDTIGCTIEVKGEGRAVICDKDDKKKKLWVLFAGDTEPEELHYKSPEIKWIASPQLAPGHDVGIPAKAIWDDIPMDVVGSRPPLHATIGLFFEARELDGVMRGKVVGIKCKSSGKFMKKLFVNFFDDKNVLECDNIQEYEYEFTKDPKTFKWFARA